MSQKAMDLPRSMQIVRRHKMLVGAVVVLGILGGAAYAVLRPPLLTATALVALQAPANATAINAQTGATIDTFTPTEEIVAGSNQVLIDALPNVRPAMSLDELRLDVNIGSPSADLISVSAKGKTAADAEATANAVANSYISYVTSARSAVGRIQAQLLQAASEATGPKPVEQIIIYGLLGGLAGALIGVVVALAVGRDDRRLRERDGIARSIGIPVLASVPVARPSAAAGWTKLLESYKPASVHSWQLRTALQQLGIPKPGRHAYDANGSPPYGDDRASARDGDSGRSSLMVLSLSSDSGALALGPQLAAFAASQGIPTALIIGPQQDAAPTATLRTACAAPLPDASTRQGMLQAFAYDGGSVDMQPDTALVIVVAVVDSRAPKMPDTMRTNATVIGVSAGSATAEQLARAAVAAGADGREITGILVADPDPADQTTGRIPQLAQSARGTLPNRMRGVVTEIKR
jgi:capsular polysaccharide biosynthesis protein